MTVAGDKGWSIDDEVLHLRVRGMRGPEYVRELPKPPIDEVTIGSMSECTFQLVDESGMVSRRHAILKRAGATWTVSDAASTNGTRCDGLRRTMFDLAPGVELGIGSIEMVAESAKLIALRDLLDRWIGWSASRHAAVDAALRAVRYFATMRSVLVLRGEGALVPLAADLHRKTLGRKRPFVLAPTGNDGIAALRAADQGTLCIDPLSLPDDWPQVVAELMQPSLSSRIIMCAPRDPDEKADAVVAQLPGATTMKLPRLSSRTDERRRLLEEYAADAVAMFQLPSHRVRPVDWERLEARTYRGLAKIAHDARRLVALREWGIADGAARLGISHSTLSRWALRRKLATF
jgi:hypothetical protein